MVKVGLGLLVACLLGMLAFAGDVPDIVRVTEDAKEAKARIGQTVYFEYKASIQLEKSVGDFEVSIDFKKVSKPEVKLKGAIGEGTISCVFRVDKKTTAGRKYVIEITPIGLDQKKKQTRRIT